MFILFHLISSWFIGIFVEVSWVLRVVFLYFCLSVFLSFCPSLSLPLVQISIQNLVIRDIKTSGLRKLLICNKQAPLKRRRQSQSLVDFQVYLDIVSRNFVSLTSSAGDMIIKFPFLQNSLNFPYQGWQNIWVTFFPWRRRDQYIGAILHNRSSFSSK